MIVPRKGTDQAVTPGVACTRLRKTLTEANRWAGQQREKLLVGSPH
jgi:hypothetical protein